MNVIIMKPEIEGAQNMERVLPLSKSVFSGSAACRGCGAMLGMKLMLQAIDSCVIVNSTGCISLTGKHVKVPFVSAGLNACAVARGIQNSIAIDEKDRQEKTAVVVFAGDGATRMNLQSLIAAKEGIIYVCYNNQGFSSLGQKELWSSLAKQVAFTASYVATASVAFPEDFVKKLQKAKTKPGFKFIELHAPCPIEWGFDPSNTIEVSRLAVETGFWPLYEIEDHAINLSKSLTRLEPVERYFELLAFKPAEAQLKSLQHDISKNWRLLSEGKLI